MASLSTKAVAAVTLVTVLSVFVSTGVRAQTENYTTSAATAYDSGWLPAKATWYGAPTGAGPDDNGGACGFKNTNQYPFSSMTSCGNEPIFKDGKGCGACYQIRCTKKNHPACSGKPQTVIITDMNYYPVAKYHFDLSGTAFGAMAMPGLNDKLRHAGIIDMQFKRVLCNMRGLTITFHVHHTSNPNYLAVLVEYANKDGTIVQVDINENNHGWVPMRESWGDIWRIDSAKPLIGPFSLRVRSDGGQTLVANNVIPRNWKPDADYHSNIQFY
ncbi:hypothetical protein PR202_gb07414 [Eleusine coracana subsp. coracana]|uniref:Uncharacterized protein n=1 Tax=Eleusine coracana subsp. coracana TaxID=191504 RepID=A0AAV5ECZ3_ELECO|nr:hypothetical protein QOZ80_2BG0169980 [Eleusine coracana subsp. coracana]GJN20086.1 hypothetical protein PR202_gb07414 [Eleusine coracana subsp. coracana]